MTTTYRGKFKCERGCGMETDTDDLTVIGRNCSATAFEEEHRMYPTTPTLAPATVEARPANGCEPGGFTVVVEWQPHPDLDRLDAHAWGLGPKHRTLAQRLARAVNAGAVLDVRPDGGYTDCYGKRGWHADSRILSRTMNADLRRLGY